MKKMFLAVAIVGATTILVSCKKDYTCECTGIGVTFTYDTLLTDKTKSDAEAACNSLDVNVLGLGQECELK